MKKFATFLAWAEPHLPTAKQLELLSANELQRASQFKSQKRRAEFLCGRVLLREALSTYTGISPAAHKLSIDGSGKPYCETGPAISITHSGSRIVCAVSNDRRVGVDVECRNRSRNTNGIAKLFFSAEDALWLASQAEESFYWLWVLKEAWLKARGMGLAGGLSQLQCRITPPVIHVSDKLSECRNLTLFTLGESALALASDREAIITLARWRTENQCFSSCQEARLLASTNQSGPIIRQFA